MEISETMSWIGSVLAMMAVMQGFIPSESRHYFVDRLISLISPYAYYIVLEYEGTSPNELYAAVQTYLSSLTRQRARKSNLSMAKNAKSFTFSLTKKERIRDTFESVAVEWIHNVEERRNALWVGWNNSDERRSFQVKMPCRHKDFLLDSYLSHIVEEAKVLERSNRDLNLYFNRNDDRNGLSGGWNHIPFKHPASFDTIAMDPEQKFSLMSDLDSFVHGEDFYKRVGKAWKRGYLLFGPPGTGKTSIIAATANKLHYDVYDLELTEVQTNSDLRKLLLHTSSKSIVVIEDIDCSLDLSGQRKKKKKKSAEKEPGAPGTKPDEEDKSSKVTLSGLLNFTDGLWSACGSERIFIFTTNSVKKLDRALLRPGRMDMHINLNYCRYPAFKALARNFLQINDHPRFADVQQIIDSSFMSPAEIAEILTKDRSNPDLAIDLVVKALHDRKSKPPPSQDEDDAREDDNDSELDESQEVSSDGKITKDSNHDPSDGKTTKDTNPDS